MFSSNVSSAALLFSASSQSSALAQSTTPLNKAHCLPPTRKSDPFLDPNACAEALNYFSSDHAGLSHFTNNNNETAVESGTVKLPWERTDGGCRVRVEIQHADESETPVHDVWERGMTLVSRCLIHSDSIGGKIVVDDEAGLTVSIRPEGDDEGDWERRVEKGSVVVGEERDFKPVFLDRLAEERAAGRGSLPD